MARLVTFLAGVGVAYYIFNHGPEINRVIAERRVRLVRYRYI
jgi:hypothetical protein